MFVFHHCTQKRKFKIRMLLFVIPAILACAFLLWTSLYYHADESAVAALRSDGVVAVKQESTGWMFDGPSEESVLIFYPGAKVEEISYAPLLHRLAEDVMDVFLIKMPLRLAFFGIDKAEKVIENSSYTHYYIGGHSLGGAMAAGYAAEHEHDLAGMILLAAYPIKETDVDTVIIYGTEDGILNRNRMEKAKDLITGRYRECVMEGGNHAQFGNYGKQSGDGKAGITDREQQDKTIQEVISFFHDETGDRKRDRGR